MLSHERAILILVFSIVGAYFTTRGSLDLVGLGWRSHVTKHGGTS